MAKKKAEPEVVVAPVVEVAEAPVVVEPENLQVLPLGDGRYIERRRERERTITVNGDRYEHVTEDADGKWIYAKS